MTTTLSQAREDFAIWYDSKSEEYQALIDVVADHTDFIIDENDYDTFIEELVNYGINDPTDFQDAFHGEYEGHDERVFAEFSEQFVDDCGYSMSPEFLINCIDWELVWHSKLCRDFHTVEFKGNTYFFRNV